ncbi:MAG: retroviral-like aspartic protease family protein, partial [Alphaproteobacteria bacterium]
MNQTFRMVLGLIAALALAMQPARAADTLNCTLARLTSLVLIPIGGLNSIQAQLNGQTMYLIVDTGAVISMLRASSAAKLNLPVRQSKLVYLRDVYGNEVSTYVTVDELVLGQLKGKGINFMIMPDTMATEFMDGLLGPDLISAFDAEFDFGRADLNLYSPKHCKGQVVYWTNEPYAAVPLHLDATRHIAMDLELDGQKIETLIDTGATDSFLPRALAQRLFKWRADPPELKARSANVNGTETVLYSYPFKTLSFEGVNITNPQITLTSDLLKGDSKLILGMNILS